MTTKLNRRDVGYTIISRFEESFRCFLAQGLESLFDHYREGIPVGAISKAEERSSGKEWDSVGELLEDVDFPDLKEIACYKSNYSTYFPRSDISVQDFNSLMDELYELRCKIAHIRGYFTSLDLDKLSEISIKIAKHLDESGKEFLAFSKTLAEEPEKVIISMPIEFGSENDFQSVIPNNIPLADYEFEGGFVGRNTDIKKVTRLLEGEQVVTIAGAGGVGKTALASKVVEGFLKQSNNCFDGIIWLSAKENKLSYLGIEDVEPTIKNYEQLLETVLEVMGFPHTVDSSLESKEHDLKIVADLYKCILVVIDNLETITDEDIVDFLLDIRVNYPNIKVLITSRRGLGQVERRYELKELKEKEAVQLFRLIAKDKGLDSLAKLEESIISTLVKKLSCYPLAIKWMLGKVAIGKGIYEVIDSIDETTSDISKFSFEQIYNSLSGPARNILCTLSCFDEPPSAGVLRYVVDLEKDNLEDGIQELILVSLIISEQFKNEQGELSTRYILLPLTRGYVRQQLDRDTLLKRSIEERLRNVQTTIEEGERATRLYRFNLSNMGAVTEEEKVAAMIAQNAFQKYQTGRYIEAYEEYKRACDIAPRFASIYRNWAVMESQEGHLIEADKLMEKASTLSPKDPQIWLTWGNIKRKNDRINDALEKYERAYKLDSADPIILNSLGQAKCRSGDYEEADRLFHSAIQSEVSGSKVKHEIINLSSLAENLSRWGEALSNYRNNDAAEQKLQEALQFAQRLIELDKDDPKSERLLFDIYRKLGFFYKKTHDYSKAIEYFEKSILKKPKQYFQVKNTVVSVIQACKLLQQMGDRKRALSLCTQDIQRASERLENDVHLQKELKSLISSLEGSSLEGSSQSAVRGKIQRVNVERGFAIILSLGTSASYIGHVSNFIPNIDLLSNSMVSKVVEFIPEDTKSPDGNTRREAKYIRFTD
jgi:LuxR family glucitol operon transcriptional activator